jgi:hypothetical protein
LATVLSPATASVLLPSEANDPFYFPDIPRQDEPTMFHEPTKRRLSWVAAVLVTLVFVLFIGEKYEDPIIRARIESSMNRSLVGYKTSLESARLRFFDGTLFLYGLAVVQDAHPMPPVITIPMLRISIQWRELLWGKVVADCLISQPIASINLTQLRSERSSKRSVSQEGWQQALESIYPFKINKFSIQDGNITYIDTDPSRPIKLEHLQIVADNIRNIHAPENRYPSPIHLDTVVFGTGHASLDGHADFLAVPLPGVLTQYNIDRVPLAPFGPAIQRVNLRVKSGTVSSTGTLEYAPNIKRAEVNRLSIDGVQLTYIHTPQTAAAEAARATTIKRGAEEVNNKQGLLLKIQDLSIANSLFTYSNDDSDHLYALYMSGVNAHLSNLSNQANEGSSAIDLKGRFMGSGDTRLTGTFRPQKQGPDFNLNMGVENTDLPSLNDLLRAYGRFDVQSGKLSVFSQTTVNHGAITGYVKTLFSNVVVYDRNKDANKPVLHQAYELMIGGAAKLLKNGSSQKVATEVSLNGKLDKPNTSTWEALIELLHNAFINAIEPGFDHEIGAMTPSTGSTSTGPKQ